MATMAGKRPKHLNLLKIKLPLPAVVSILHRVSGALLFAVIPLFLGVFQLTLASTESYETVRQCLASPLAKLALIGLAWGFLHHFFAGLRYLVMDIGYGLDLDKTRRSSKWVMVFSLGSTLLLGVWLW
ncbi:MAG: succinate dehydrogenase, cytochrome b556 subunit [Betaproteobacteria bacterium]